MRRLTTTLLFLAAASPAFAQRAAGTYVVSRGGTEIGREEFTLDAGRARDRSGTSLTVRSSYPGAVPSGNVSALLLVKLASDTYELERAKAIANDMNEGYPDEEPETPSIAARM